MVIEQECFVVMAYGVAAVVILAICVDTYLRWRRVRHDYARLFGRKAGGDQTDA